MVKRIEERIEMNEKKKDILKTWEDSYIAISKIWDDSLKLYRPMLESTGELFGRSVELSKDAAPEKYKEFYDQWVKTYQDSTGKFYQISSLESNRETFEKLLVSVEESNKIYRSWIDELEENSRVTREVLQGEPDPAKYKEVYDLWLKSYGKVFDELLTLPFRQNIKNLFENLTGTPDIYSDTIEQISKQWKDSYARLYSPWIDSILKLSAKSAEISRGKANPQVYKEFYNLWLDTYQETYGNLIEIKSENTSKEVFESFVQSVNINLSLNRSWIATLEKLSHKAKDISKQTADPEVYTEFYNLWAKTYGKAIDNFFENTPAISPFKEILGPVKNAAKIYAYTFTSISGGKSQPSPVSAV
jgi:hypothetical protein